MTRTITHIERSRTVDTVISGPAGPLTVVDGDSALALHVVDVNPHPTAHSGRDFAALFTNGIT